MNKRFRLTTEQKKIFLEHISHKSKPFCSIGGYFCLPAIDETAFVKSFTHLVHTNSVFRLRFEECGGEVWQYFSDTPTEHLECVSFTDVQEPEKNALALLKEKLNSPFDVHSSQLYRAVLIKCRPDRYYFGFFAHHLIFDGWSLNLIPKKLQEAYIETLHHWPSDESELVSQSEQDTLYEKSSRYDRDKSYWEKVFSEFRPNTRSLEYKKQIEQFSCSTIEYPISAETSLGVGNLAHAYSVHFSIVHLAALTAFFSKTTGKQDFTIEQILHNRTSRNSKNLLASLAAARPLLAKVNDGDSFFSLVSKIQTSQKGLLRHRKFSPSKILNQAGPGRPSLVLNYDFSFNYLSLADGVDFDGEKIFTRRMDPSLQYEPLVINLYELRDQGKILLRISFLDSSFDSDQISRLAHRYENFLLSIIQKPTEPFEQLCCATDADRDFSERQLASCQPTFVENVTLQQLVSEQAKRRPNAQAVSNVELTTSYTYAELDTLSNNFSSYLIAQGICANDRVGLCMASSPDFLVAFLAILKCGATVVPINLNMPKEPLIGCIQAVGMEWIVVDNVYKGTTSEFETANVIDVGDGELFRSRFEPSIPALRDVSISSKSAAYIIFTSGSTGAPKGVKVGHEELINHLLSSSRFLNISASDNVLQLNSVFFDSFIEQSFGALISGASLFLSTKFLLTPAEFLQVTNSHQISLVDMPTAFFTQTVLDNQLDNWTTCSLTRIVIGGEALAANVVEKWIKSNLSTHCQLINAYGPTEATISTTYQIIDKFDASRVRIGKAVGHRILYVVNDFGCLVKPGECGELYIGGRCLALGYVGVNDTSSRNFVADHFRQSPQESDQIPRMYRTGDIVKVCQDGALEYIGRKDTQVKIRGYRIELDAIGNQISMHQRIKQCVAVARINRLGRKCIVAYVTLESASASAGPFHTQYMNIESEIKHYARQKLPEYMLPSHFIVLESFPIGVSGKIDKNQLPEPWSEDIDNDYVQASTAVEKQVVSIVAQITHLDLSQVSIDMSFFELGADSLMAASFVNNLNEVFDVECKLEDIFEMESLRSFSSNLQNKLYFNNPDSYVDELQVGGEWL